MFGVDFISQKYICQREVMYMPFNVYATYFRAIGIRVWGMDDTNNPCCSIYLDTFVE